nr:hypothetical protein [Tanacetum cinerariifolium]
GGSDNHRSNNNYSGNNNRSSGNGRDQRNRGQQPNRPVNSDFQQSSGPSEGYSYPVCTTCGRRHPGECHQAANTCFKCGQTGHLQKDCKKNTAASTSGQADKKPGESSHWQYKFPLLVEGVPTARRMEIPLPGVCTAMMKKLPVKEKWQLH